MLDDYYNWLRLNTTSQKTLLTYYTGTKNLLKFLDGLEVNQENINKYLVSKLDNGAQLSYFNKLICTLINYLKYLNITDISLPPLKKVNRKIKQFMTIEEFDKDVCKLIISEFQLEKSKEYELLFKTFFFTGARVGEVMSLKKEDINFENKYILIKDTKGKKDRRIPFLDENFEREFKKHYILLDRDNIFNFSYTQICYAFKKVKELLSLKYDFTPHILRHSFGRYCVRKGLNLKIIQELMGHSDIKITDQYTDVTWDIVAEACKKIKRKTRRK